MEAKDKHTLPDALSVFTEIDTDYTMVLIPFISMTIANSEVPEKIAKLRFEALMQLKERLAYYKSHGYMESLLCAIARKMAKMIVTATSKTEIEKVMKLTAPHYDGNKFIADEYSVPEEEMISWAETSLRGPLIEPAFKRYKELFEQIFPEQSKMIFK